MGWGVSDYPGPPPEPPVPVCPVCHEECSLIVSNVNGKEIGCDVCLNIQDAYFWMEEKENA